MSHFDVPPKLRLQSDAQRLHLGPVRYDYVTVTFFFFSLLLLSHFHFPPFRGRPSIPAQPVQSRHRASLVSPLSRESNLRRRMENRRGINPEETQQ